MIEANSEQFLTISMRYKLKWTNLEGLENINMNQYHIGYDRYHDQWFHYNFPVYHEHRSVLGVNITISVY